MTKLPYNTISDLNSNHGFSGQKILLRVDFNTPIASDGEIADDTRIKAHVDTIRTLLDAKAKLIIISHMTDNSLSLAKVAERLSKLLDGYPVAFANDCIGKEITDTVASLQDGEVLLLENTRQHPEELENDIGFAEELSNHGDFFINDAFATAHRAHASTVGIASFFDADKRGIGLLVEKEVLALRKITKEPARPFVAIVGGSKITTKLAILKNIVTKADSLIIGGGLANTFLYALNNPIGNSLYQVECCNDAREVLRIAGSCGCRIILPEFVVVAKEFKEGAETRDINVKDVEDDDIILDVGNNSLRGYEKTLEKSKSILWNGPLGAFEIPPFNKGTDFLTSAVANADSYSVAGGGDTVSAINHSKYGTEDFGYISTAGGALLTYLEGNGLPALEALLD